MNFNTDLLRDIYASGLSLGWGWYLLGTLGLLSCCLIYLYWRYRKNKYAYRALAIKALKTCNQELLGVSTYLARINEILKFTAVQAYPHDQVAALCGTSWLSFLDQHWPKKGKLSFSKHTHELLVHDIYDKAKPIESKQLDQLHATALAWIKTHRC